MDIILIAIGIGLIVGGNYTRDGAGERTGLGTGLHITGVTITIIGAILFALGFMAGFVGAT